MRLWDEVGFGAGVTGVQDVGDVVLLHQILETENREGSDQGPVLPGQHDPVYPGWSYLE